MSKANHLTLVLGLATATSLTVACRDSSSPLRDGVGQPSLEEVPPPPHEEQPPHQPACFRLTGGGRIDVPEPQPPSKNTPDSRDFATFGFQARPTSCNTTDGTGNITWVEHNPAAIGGGFTFHGRVTTFAEVADHLGPTGDPKDGCGTFSGFGRARRRDGQTFEDLPFTVDHACDRGEPGRNDHIRMIIESEATYARDGFLTGGNIQKHKLSGGGQGT